MRTGNLFMFVQFSGSKWLEDFLLSLFFSLMPTSPTRPNFFDAQNTASETPKIHLKDLNDFIGDLPGDLTNYE